jgi:hypothetical protein
VAIIWLQQSDITVKHPRGAPTESPTIWMAAATQWTTKRKNRFCLYDFIDKLVVQKFIQKHLGNDLELITIVAQPIGGADAL